MINAKNYAYWQIRSYICSQIAYEKENKDTAMYDTVENADYIADREDLIHTYQTILNILTNNKGKIIK